jgi:hypothetical protein
MLIPLDIDYQLRQGGRPKKAPEMRLKCARNFIFGQSAFCGPARSSLSLESDWEAADEYHDTIGLGLHCTSLWMAKFAQPL